MKKIKKWVTWQPLIEVEIEIPDNATKEEIDKLAIEAAIDDYDAGHEERLEEYNLTVEDPEI